jgi:hypothetical protein
MVCQMHVYKTAAYIVRVPPNVKFEVDDVESAWAYSEPFDYIFCRYLCTAIKDWPGLVKSTFELVNHLNYGTYP